MARRRSPGSARPARGFGFLQTWSGRLLSMPCGQGRVDSRSDDERRRIETLVDPQRRDGVVACLLQVGSCSCAAFVIALVKAAGGQREQTVGGFLGRRLAVEAPRAIRVLRVAQPIARLAHRVDDWPGLVWLQLVQGE